MGGREGGGENFFVCEYLYTVKGLIKRNGEVVCLSLTQHGGESEGVACSYDSIQNLKKKKKMIFNMGDMVVQWTKKVMVSILGLGHFSCPGSPLSSHCRLL